MPRWLTDPVAEVWPGLSEDETRRVTRWVGRAELIIDQRFPATAARVEAGTMDVGIVAGVVEDMVTRALDKHRRGGLDKLSYPEVSMEWSGSSAGEASTLFLTVDELMLLTPPDPPERFTIRRKARPSW